jgi:hypothetical protein
MIIKRLVASIRQPFPAVMILLRGDGHFSCPEVHDFCEDNAVFYVLGQGGNTRLQALGASLLEQAKALAAATEPPGRLFTAFSYQAGSWAVPRRLIVKAEMTESGPKPRSGVTNLDRSQPSFIYDRLSCARGRMEGVIKNHKPALPSERTACHRFEANQFRLFLHSAASVLIHALVTQGLPGTTWMTAQFDTIQKRLLKVGARLCELATKIQFPSAFPLKEGSQRLQISRAQASG